jgi:hypothetical protein
MPTSPHPSSLLGAALIGALAWGPAWGADATAATSATAAATDPVTAPHALDIAITAHWARDFLGSMGSNSAISRRGEKLEETIAFTRYTGIRWFRTGYESDIPVADLIAVHRATGAEFSYGLLSGGTDLTRLLAGARALAAAGALKAIEGPNEPNNWGPTYHGEAGGGAKSWLPVAKLQHDLYQAVKHDPILGAYPVWSLTENGAQTDNVGLQFLTIPAGAGCLMPDGTQYADFANVHNYIGHPNWPGWHDNQGWVTADPGPDCKVDGLYGNYGKTWLKGFAGYTPEQCATLPRVTTETGRTIDEPDTTEEQQAALFTDFYLDQYARGVAATAFYLLRDRVDETGNQRFGLYAPDNKPRKSAVAVHNLTTILADRAPAAGLNPVSAPATLSCTVNGMVPTAHDLLLEKSDGTLVLVLWDERFATPGGDVLTLHFAPAWPSVRLFDPTVGEDAVATLQDADTVQVSLRDHPVAIELSGR